MRTVEADCERRTAVGGDSLKAPFSVRYLAACEWFLSGIAGFLGLMYLVYGFYGLLHADFVRVLIATAWAVGMATVAVGCFYTASGLLRGRRWAWRASWLIGMAGAVPGGFFLGVFHRPWPGYGGEEAWGFLIDAALALPALAGFVSLVLPGTRRFFAGHA